MTALARKKTTKKPGRRRTAAKSGGSLGKLGWAAAAVVAVGWVASDGRAMGYIDKLMPAATTYVAGIKREATEAWAPKASTRASPARDTEHRQITQRDPDTRSTRDAQPPRRPAMRDDSPQSPAPRSPRPPAAVPTRVAAISPSPAPRLSPLRMPREGDGEEPRRPMRVLPPTETPSAAGPAAPVAMAPSAAPAGGLRHATRLLIIRDAPDDSGKHVGSVVAGMQVEVLRAAGQWRYVRADDGEGWVDGTFLAGESAALTAPALQTMAAVVPRAASVPTTLTAPVPPLAIRNR